MEAVVYNQHGKQTSTPSPTDHQLKPEGVVGRNGENLASDQNSKSVLMFDNNLNFVTEIDLVPGKIALPVSSLAEPGQH